MENSNFFGNDVEYLDLFGSRVEEDDSLIIILKDKFLYILESNVIDSKSRNLLNIYSSMLDSSKFNIEDFRDIKKLFGPLLCIKDLVACCTRCISLEAN